MDNLFRTIPTPGPEDPDEAEFPTLDPFDDWAVGSDCGNGAEDSGAAVVGDAEGSPWFTILSTVFSSVI